VKDALAAGRVDLLIGTHAALAADVRFPRLGLAVFDEQHRFGVLQRLAGRNKAEQPHLLALSATPIPRSLCLGLFGELAITRIEGRPAGRATPVTSISSRDVAYADLRAAVARGERAFVIFPSIASEEAPAIEREGRVLASVKGPLRGLACGVLHGALRGEEQAAAFTAFSSGAVQVLIATVIVEVGIDVPEATIMVVEGAERFGLATLHQLRGRVGRGAKAGRVHLVPSDHAREGGDAAARAERLELLERETDGFKIAEADLELRGPGDWCGVRQHGFGGSLPLAAGRDAGFIDEVGATARELIARGYHGRHAEYFSALSAAIGGIRFEPKDAV
jgi:ATP-dependent DNA helicase RecG